MVNTGNSNRKFLSKFKFGFWEISLLEYFGKGLGWGPWIDVWPILKPGFDLFTKLRKIEFNFSFEPGYDTITDDVIITCIPMI